MGCIKLIQFMPIGARDLKKQLIQLFSYYCTLKIKSDEFMPSATPLCRPLIIIRIRSTHSYLMHLIRARPGNRQLTTGVLSRNNF